MKKTLLKTITAALLISVMAASVCACSLSAVDENPVIGKVGRITITFDDYKTVYMNYYQYIQMGYMNTDGLNKIIKEQLVRNAVTLNQAYEQEIEIDEAELEAKVQEELNKALESMEIDKSITDPDEQREARLKAFKKVLRKNGKSYNEYLKDTEKNIRENMMTEGLRNKINAAVEACFDESRVETYFNEELQKLHDEYLKTDDKPDTDAIEADEPKDTASPDTDKPDKPEDKFADVKKFRQAYTDYLTKGGLIPFFCPEGMFTVKHILVKFSEEPKTPGATPDPAAEEPEKTYNEDAQAKLDQIHEALKDGNTTTVEDFEKLIDELGEDPGMKQDGYKEHGYLMHEGLIDTYFPGFGLYAMKLMYGEDWEPTPEEPEPTDESAPTDEPEHSDETAPSDKPDKDKPEYEFKGYYTISDAESNPVKIAEVETTAGTHFIIVGSKKLDEYKDEGLQDAEGNIIGYDLNFVNDKENDIWKNIYDYLLKDEQKKRYDEEYKGWEADTKIKMKDKYIDQLAASMFGLK